MESANTQLRPVVLVFLGGAVGAVARVAFATMFPVADGAYPWTTFAENVLGAFLLGCVVSVLASRSSVDPTSQLFFGTGVLGAFTTYSTFSVEIERLLDADRIILAATYAGTSLVAGIAAAAGGFALGRSLTARQGGSNRPGGTDA